MSTHVSPNPFTVWEVESPHKSKGRLRPVYWLPGVAPCFLPEPNLLASSAVEIYELEMASDRFPSGPWTGFYAYAPQNKHRMDLELTFTNGNLNGSGSDDIGRFLVKGRYNEASCECYWTKSYIGAHDVFYRGYREGKGIWGRWEIHSSFHGGFHIWPLGIEAGAQEVRHEAESEPAEAVGTEHSSAGSNAI